MTTLTDSNQRNATEARPLAKELANARQELVEAFEQNHGLTREEAVARVREFDSSEYAAHVLQQPLSATIWQDLDQLAAVDPNAAASRWDALVDESRDAWDSGHRSAEAMDVAEPRCAARAEFIALRERLAENWQIDNGVEAVLIDAMAEAYTLKLKWIKRMLALDALEQSSGMSDKLGLPTVTMFQAIEQAAQMVDRFDRMFMRAGRQLRDLRRYAPTVVVQTAGQVNVADQQVNVSSD